VFVTGIYEETQVPFSAFCLFSARALLCAVRVGMTTCSCSILSSHCVQEDDVLDKFGEYGTVKAGTTVAACPRRAALSLTCGTCSEHADGPQNRLHQRIRFCGVRDQTG
jgi:hypothetical protein